MCPEAVADDEGAVVGRRAVLAHRDRHGLDDLAVAPDGQRLGVVVDGRDDLVTDGEVRGDVLLAEQPVAEIDAVGVDRDVDGGARLPVLRWAPTHFAVAEPVEGALDGRVGGDGDRPLRRQPVRDVLVEADRDGLTDAHDLAVVRQHVGHRQVLRRVGLERHLLAGGTAETQRLRVQRVALVVAERLGGAPGQAIGAQLAGDRGALVVVDHRDRAEHAVLGADGHRRVHRHADGTVLHRRGELGHQQVAERRALVGDDLRLRRS